MAAQTPDRPLEAYLADCSDAELQMQLRQYDADIARLQVFRNVAAGMLEARRLLNGAAAKTEESQPAVHRPGLHDALLTIMRENVQRKDEWTSYELLRHLEARGWEPRSKTPKNSVDATLSRLTQAGNVFRLRRGTYALPDAEDAAEGLRGAPDSGSGEAR